MTQSAQNECVLCGVGLALILLAIPGATLDSPKPVNTCKSNRAVENPPNSNYYELTDCPGMALCPHPNTCDVQTGGGWTWCNCIDDQYPECCHLRINLVTNEVKQFGECASTPCPSGTCNMTENELYIYAVCN